MFAKYIYLGSGILRDFRSFFIIGFSQWKIWSGAKYFPQ